MHKKLQMLSFERYFRRTSAYRYCCVRYDALLQVCSMVCVVSVLSGTFSWWPKLLRKVQSWFNCSSYTPSSPPSRHTHRSVVFADCRCRISSKQLARARARKSPSREHHITIVAQCHTSCNSADVVNSYNTRHLRAIQIIFIFALLSEQHHDVPGKLWIYVL